jgi:hypothetical protein
MKDKENPSYLATLPSAVLETKLKQLRQDSAALSQSLTQKLANSQSGQNLLHIGPSLSTLPPDLSTLLTNLSPLLDDVTDYERANLAELTRIVDAGTAIRLAQRRADHASDCTDLLQDLMAAETNIKRDSDVRLAAISAQSSSKGSINGTSNNNTDSPNLSADPTEAQEDDLGTHTKTMCIHSHASYNCSRIHVSHLCVLCLSDTVVVLVYVVIR